MKLFVVFFSSILLKKSVFAQLRGTKWDTLRLQAEPPTPNPMKTEKENDASKRRRLQGNNDGPNPQDSAADQVYQYLMKLFDVPSEEVLVMEFPGRVFDESKFAYDTTKVYSPAEKPQFVKEAEFQFTNDLFDVDLTVNNTNGHVVAGPTGRKLSDSYELALSNLVPDPAGKNQEALYADQKKVKDWLYEEITQPYGGSMYTGTRIGLTTRMYEKYADAREKWLNQKNEMLAKAENAKASEKMELYDAYAKQIATVGFEKEEEITALYNDLITLGNYHKVNSIISLIDIESDAAVFEKLKSKLRKTQMLSFDETETIYPVQIQPDNWFKDLSTDFAPEDLLLDPEAVKMELVEKIELATDLSEQINTLQATPTSNRTLAELQSDVDSAQEDLNNAKNAMLKNLNAATYQVINIAYRTYCQKNGIDPDTGKVDDAFDKAEAEAGATQGIAITQDDINAFKNYTDQEIGFQTNFQTASRQLSNMLEQQAEAESTQTKTQVVNLQSQLKILQAAISELEAQVNSGASLIPVSNTTTYNFKDKTDMVPKNPTVDGFFEVVMNFDKDDDRQASKMKSGASQTQVDVDTFFGSFGYSSSSEHSDFTQNHTTTHSTFQIGFRAAKVDFVRDWFSPEIFENSGDMYHLGDSGHDFKTYPQSAIIAKDITIKIEFDETETKMANSMMKSSSGESGGFFIFSASHSESSNQQSKSYYSGSKSNGIMIKIPGPQVLLWILEKVPVDQSRPYPASPGLITDAFIASLS